MVGPVSMFFISSPVWTGSITLYRISISNDIFDKRRLALFSTDIKSIIYIDCNSIAIIAIFNDFWSLHVFFLFMFGFYRIWTGFTQFLSRELNSACFFGIFNSYQERYLNFSCFYWDYRGFQRYLPSFWWGQHGFFLFKFGFLPDLDGFFHTRVSKPSVKKKAKQENALLGRQGKRKWRHDGEPDERKKPMRRPINLDCPVYRLFPPA